MKNLWLLIVFLPLFLFGQTSVPNTETFNLQDVYNAVHAHTSGTKTNLQSCFDNAISGYFNATYNQDSYAPVNSMLRFRDYKPNGCSAPTVTTASISNIQPFTASGGGNVTSDGGCSVTARGVCWNTSTNPTISNSHTTDGSGTGSFSSSITGLSSATTYYVRAYATNSSGTAYGNQYSFTTSCILPSFIAASCGNATNNSIYATATISSDGGCSVISRGFQYSTDASFNTVLGSVTASGTGIGQYYATITGLTCNTQYYFRPWATNSAGTYYATSLIGSGCMTSNSIPAIQTLTASNITSTSFTLSADPIQAGCPAYTTYSSIMMDTSSSFTNYCRIDSPTPNSLNSFSVTFSGTQCNAISIQSNTTYYWRGVIVSNGNTYYGETKTVTTLP